MHASGYLLSYMPAPWEFFCLAPIHLMTQYLTNLLSGIIFYPFIPSHDPRSLLKFVVMVAEMSSEEDLLTMSVQHPQPFLCRFVVPV